METFKFTHLVRTRGFSADFESFLGSLNWYKLGKYLTLTLGVNQEALFRIHSEKLYRSIKTYLIIKNCLLE